MIKIVTDSTCDLPLEMIEKMGVEVVPLYVLFGTKSYRDLFDLPAEKFYKKVLSEDIIPTTSMPSPGDFLNVYEDIIKQGDTIISIHISDKLSGTIKSARSARNLLKEDYEGADISILDSNNASLGLGMIVIRAWEMVEEGLTKEEILNKLKNYIKNNQAAFITMDFEHLKKSGRISSAKAFLGSLLNMAPMLIMEKGELKGKGKVLGLKAAYKKIIKYIREKSKEEPPKFLSVVSGSNEKDREILYDILRKVFSRCRIRKGKIGSVIGTHIGPSSLGVLWF